MALTDCLRHTNQIAALGLQLVSLPWQRRKKMLVGQGGGKCIFWTKVTLMGKTVSDDGEIPGEKKKIQPSVYSESFKGKCGDKSL